MTNLSTWKQIILFKLLKRNFFKSLLTGLVFAVIGIGLGIFVKPATYESSGQMVQNDNNYGLINSYGQYLTSAEYKSKLQAEIDQSSWKNYSKKDDYSVSISTGTSSPFFSINIISPNPSYSIFLANHAMSLFISNIGKYLSGANVSLVNNAKKSTRVSIKRSLMAIAMTVFVVVFFLVLIISSFRQLMLGKVKSDDYLRSVVGINKIGTFDIKN
ncbi:polysaccharide biosynthesis protein [Lactiplantibacillus xiangfangensis]|uniref:Polysaccharide biosynthesis protein n=1 Tax=Lactiplantibacillus xiangfangensis TaxID=942150 RepID=A0A0R2MJA8_9LACO|nr:polysaccharide biosynthesis protein [Lactiplantibacillus xiangfangensis]